MSSEAGTASKPPLVHIRPTPGWRLPDLGELWRFRHVMVMLGVRDLKVRYKQTFLGATWVIIQPLIGAGIFSFVFGGVAGMAAPGDVPYFLFSYIGLLGWNLFSGTVNRSNSGMVSSAGLIQKVYFPRLLIPLSQLFSSLVDFAVAAALGVILLLIVWSPPGLLGIAVAVGCLLLFLMLALGIGLTAGAVSVHYRDVNYLIPVFLQFLLYASPVAYALDEVPEKYMLFYLLNPLAGLLETFRWAVLGVGELTPMTTVYPAALSLLAFGVGILVFKRLERGFADVV